ncbi:cardiolipin synthase [Fictibacillus sp. KU28468]|uniref:cardiolipin synthase n=1 Tax=Fictibacillus sp. KU28468 TaxID=2991053 RepID=UPI00223DDF9C|nr:cardiolipin synthase [Fictibacillus sp. KU28468]UZJ79136.1 cardiolipin synthase [Fictibacillus sp. KU28468]
MAIVYSILILLLAAVIIAVFIWLDFQLGKKNVAKKELEDPAVCTGEAVLITTGTDFFDTLFEEIEQAKHHLHIQFYIFNEDCIGKEMTSLLKRKAREGVAVRLLVDYMGSFFLKKKAIHEMKLAGVQFAYSFKPEFPYFFYKLNRRNHRKITIIDGKKGFTGGFNVGDEYLGRDPKLGDWRDYHLQLDGPVIHSLQHQFLLDWEEASCEKLSGNSYFPELEEGPQTFTALFSSKQIYSFFLQRIEQAQTRIFIGSPYFIPDASLQRALLRALKRGVEVILLVPMKSDHPLVKEASYPYLRELLKAGCRVDQYYEGFFHAKVFMVDEKICDIGTTNFDLRSMFTNSEVNCIFHDPELIKVTLKAIEADLARSETLQVTALDTLSLWTKTKIQISRVLLPFL